MSPVDALRALVDRVESNIERQRERLQRQIDNEVERGWQFSGQTQPEDIVDMHGRPILLDAQVALLNARAALSAHA